MLIQFPGDPFEFATRNCPECLEPLQPRTFGWWCGACERIFADEPGALSEPGATIEHLNECEDDDARTSPGGHSSLG